MCFARDIQSGEVGVLEGISKHNRVHAREYFRQSRSVGKLRVRATWLPTQGAQSTQTVESAFSGYIQKNLASKASLGSMIEIYSNVQDTVSRQSAKLQAASLKKAQIETFHNVGFMMLLKELNVYLFEQSVHDATIYYKESMES